MKARSIVALALVVGVGLVGCDLKQKTATKSKPKPAAAAPATQAPRSSTTDPPSTSAPTIPSSTPVPPATSLPPAASPSSGPGSCQARGTGLEVLPDPSCTPGATNPAVTQATINRTICVSGWTSTIRPAEIYTENLKRQQMTAYGDTRPISSYEEDHLIPLELGGSPTSPQNLWPEPGASPNPKDAVEDAARSAVCDGRIALASAQEAIASDWIAFGQQLGVTPASPPAASSPAPRTPTAPSPPTTIAQPPAPVPQTGVTIISVTSPVRAGAYASLAAQTSPGAACRLSITLPSGSHSQSQGLGAGTADASGRVQWTWKTGPTTRPGTATAFVTCGAASTTGTFQITS